MISERKVSRKHRPAPDSEGARGSTFAAGSLGVVVIGRNEAANLSTTLAAVVSTADAIVYVDSASEDGSADVARAMGVEVVELSAEGPQTASRGRNHGVARLTELAPRLDYIQFVDGDTAIVPGWLDVGRRYLDQCTDVAAVAGRLRERDRDASPYHRLADMEWDGPAGEVAALGGIAMMRREVFEAAGGFDAHVAQGEEAELYARIRRDGWTVVRLPDEMALHNIAMTHFLQWWRRTARSGASYAQHALEGRGHVKMLVSIAGWGGVFPTLALALAPPTLGGSLGVAALAYATQWHRIRRERLARGDSPRDARLYATATLLGKAAALQGAIRHGLRHVSGKRA